MLHTQCVCVVKDQGKWTDLRDIPYRFSAHALRQQINSVSIDRKGWRDHGAEY